MTEDEETADGLGEEMRDIFGDLPPELSLLLAVTSLRITAQRAGAGKVHVGRDSAIIAFSESATVDPARVVELVQAGRGSLKFKGGEELQISLGGEDPVGILERLKNLLIELTGCDTVPRKVGEEPSEPASTAAGPS